MADADDRREGRGRRGDDPALNALADRIDAAEARFERALAKLESELDRLDDAVDVRVRELEAFHIREQARAGERTARAVKRARWISSVGASSGALGIGFAIVEHFVHL